MKIDFDNPKYHAGRIEKVASPPNEDERVAILDAAASKMHTILNNSLRLCGAEVHDGNSEVTWSWLEDVMAKADRYVETALREVEIKQQIYKEINNKQSTADIMAITEFARQHSKSAEEAARMIITLQAFAAGSDLSGARLKEKLQKASEVIS